MLYANIGLENWFLPVYFFLSHIIKQHNQTNYAMRYLQLACFLFCGLQSLAQEATFSDYVKVDDRDDLFIIGGDENGVFASISDDYYHKGFSNKQIISYYNYQKGQWENKALKSEKRSREYFYSFYFQHQLHLLQYDDQPTDENKYPVYLESYDRSLAKVGEEQSIGQLSPHIFSFDAGKLLHSYFSSQYGKMHRSSFYRHKTSADQKKLVLLFNYYFLKDALSEFQFIMLDENKQGEQSGIIDLPDTEGHYQILEDYAVGNDGLIHLLVSSFDDKSFKKSAGHFKYSLYIYDPEKELLKTVEFPTEDQFIINLGLKLNEDQQPVLAGLYADAVTNDILGGMQIKSGTCTIFTFAETEVAEINTDQDKEHAEEYAIKNVVVEEDGSAVFFAESYKRGPMVKPKLSLAGFSPIDANVELGDIYRKILAIKVSPAKNHWIKIIDKTQRSSEPRDVFTSFAFTRNEQGYHLLFNNTIRNTSDVSSVSLTPDGDISLKTLFGRSEYRLRAIPAFAVSPDPGTLVLPVQKNSKQAIATVTF